MRVFWLLTRLRIAEVTRVASSSFFFFGFPLAMLLVTCMLFSGGHPFEQIRIGLVGEFASLQAALTDAQVRSQPLASADEARVRLQTGQLTAALVAAPQGWQVYVTPRQRLLGEGLLRMVSGPATLQVLDPQPWGYVHYLCPGLLAFTVVLSGLFGLGHSMARYRQNQFLRKLATTPLSKWTFLASQIAGRGLLVLVQCALLLAVMMMAFGLDLSWVQAAWTLGLCSLGLGVFLGVGLLLACLVTNEAVLSDAINGLGWPIVLGSGIFFPTDVLPGPLPMLAERLPSSQLVVLLREVMLYGAIPQPGALAILLVWSAGTFTLGGLLFDWVRER